MPIPYEILKVVDEAVTTAECLDAKKAVYAAYESGEIDAYDTSRFLRIVNRRISRNSLEAQVSDPMYSGIGPLNAKQTDRFFTKVNEDLKNPVGPVPTPKIAAGIKKILKRSKSKKGE